MNKFPFDRRTPFVFADSVPAGAPPTDDAPARTLIRIKAAGLSRDTDSRSYVSRHIGFKLGKFAGFIQDLVVRLWDESGPHGAPRYACSVAVVLEGVGPVIAERLAHDPRSAFDHALGVLEQSVRRTLQRKRHAKR